jgi:hypothetical protein
MVICLRALVYAERNKYDYDCILAAQSQKGCILGGTIALMAMGVVFQNSMSTNFVGRNSSSRFDINSPTALDLINDLSPEELEPFQSAAANAVRW